MASTRRIKERVAGARLIGGQNFNIIYRFAEGQADRYPALAAELVHMPVNVIVTWGTPASLAAKDATSEIPIIMTSGDPVAVGLVSGLSQPRGNVTDFLRKLRIWKENALNLLANCLVTFHGLSYCRIQQILIASLPKKARASPQPRCVCGLMLSRLPRNPIWATPFLRSGVYVQTRFLSLPTHFWQTFNLKSLSF